MGKILGFDSYKKKNKNSSGVKELYMADSYPGEDSFENAKEVFSECSSTLGDSAGRIKAYKRFTRLFSLPDDISLV